MTEDDAQKFIPMWQAAWDLCAAKTTEESIMLAFAALAEYNFEDIKRALTAHIRDPDAGRFPPKPADLIGKMLAGVQDGRPGPQEAWAMCPMSERDTAWMTHEMSVALAAATPLIDQGDLIAARKTFLEVYERAVNEARITNLPCSWKKSLGWNQDGRNSPCNENLAMKYLEHLNHKETELEWMQDKGERLSLLAPASQRIPPPMNEGEK